MPFAMLVALLVAWVVPPADAAAAEPPPGPAPLEITAGRQDDPVRLRLGASVWLRGEVRSSPPAEARWVVPQRTRLQADLRWRGLRTFVQLQDVRGWGTAPSLTSTPATTGLHQGYLELTGKRGASEGMIRVGRQEYFQGSMRLIGNAPWNPHMRSFDALRLRGAQGPFSIDLVGALSRTPERFTVTDEAGNERTIDSKAEGVLMGSFGVAAHESAQLEAYVIARNLEPTAAEPDRERMVLSPGARLTGKPWRGLSYDLEGYVQTGRWDGRGHGALLGSATVGYRFGGRGRPLVEGGYVVATGSGCETVGERVVCDRDLHRDVDPLFGARHRFLGILDLFAATNVQDGWLGARVEPLPWLELRTELHHFMLYDPTGRWLATNDEIVGRGPDPDNRQRTVGEELDLRASLHPWGPLTLQLGYAVFVPTGAGGRMIGESPYQLGYLLTQLAF